ncbi:MAG: DUF692 domain-containing protein [Oligoflexus sp.]|jgi:uncharacterized protein (UPF0276 family)
MLPPLQDRRSLGLGLRIPHYRDLLERDVELDYLEIISENFMGDAAIPRSVLRRFREKFPIVLHGVGLNLLGVDPLDEDYLHRLCRLADLVDAPFVSDHLCWTAHAGHHHHDLLPTPFTSDLIGYAAERAAFVQERLGRPFGLENLSSYTAFPRSEMSEWDFYPAVVKAAGCFYMLDVNNIYVSAHNQEFKPDLYLDRIEWSRVLQVHVAGHRRLDHGLLLDTHDQAVRPEVWELYAQAWRLGGPFPTLLEWDDHIPSLDLALAELSLARSYQR